MYKQIAIVGKIDLDVVSTFNWHDGVTEADKLRVAEVIFSNKNDAFMIDREYSERMKCRFKVPNTIEVEGLGEDRMVEICPMAGDKFHGEFRDKGSVVGVCDNYYFEVLHRFRCPSEAERYIDFLEVLGKSYEAVSECDVVYRLDVIASPSASRDNVAALMSAGLLEMKCVIEGGECEMTMEEGHAFDLEALMNERTWDHSVTLRRESDNKVLAHFGMNAIILEEFFWQPQHSNRYKVKITDIPLNYNQALDGLTVHLPTMRKVMDKSVDIDMISEIMLLTGIDRDNGDDMFDMVGSNVVEPGSDTKISDNDLFSIV